MYEAFYGLREKPFNLTPDPKFLYLSEKHKEAFAHLLFGIKNRSGFVMVTGEIGTGKTTLCRTLLNQLDETTEVAFIFNPYLSPEELLRKINEDFGIASKAGSVKGLIDELNAYLLDRNAKGKNCVLVIDEAQNLTPGVLEQIRLLSNLETETTKLMQIVLIGQPELMQHLSLEELRQLNQRIAARYHLHPLDTQETRQYIAYRLGVAGGRRRIHFLPRAVKLVYRFSGGTPRVINAICDRALLIGYTLETREITAAVIKKAWAEVRGERPKLKRKKRPRLGRLVPGSALIVAVVLFSVAAQFSIGYLDKHPGRWFQSRGGIRQVFASLNPFATPSPPAIDPSLVNSPPKEPPVRKAPFEPKPVVERPVAVEAPPGERTVDATFAGLVDRLDPSVSRNAAVAGILRVWNLALLTHYPLDDSVEALKTFGQNSRLSCEVMTLTLDQLEAINLPALVRLHGKSQSVWSTIVGIEFDELRITTGMSETTLIPRDVFTQCYQGEALVFWRDPNPDAPILRTTSTGEDVRVLQVQLRALGRLKKKPSGIYDDATAQAVAKLQRETGLTADGMLGRQTRMVLYSWLPGFSTPALRPLPPLVLGSDEERNDNPAPRRPAPLAKTANPPSSPQDPGPQPADQPPAAQPVTPDAGTPAPTDGSAAAPPAAEGTALPGPPPVPQGPPDPFAALATQAQVLIQELSQPGATSAPSTPGEAPSATTNNPAAGTPQPESGEGIPREATVAPPDNSAQPVKSAAEPREGPPVTKNVTPPATGGLPLVPSDRNKAPETGKR